MSILPVYDQLPILNLLESSDFQGIKSEIRTENQCESEQLIEIRIISNFDFNHICVIKIYLLHSEIFKKTFLLVTTTTILHFGIYGNDSFSQ